MEPIKVWHDLIFSGRSTESLESDLKELYKRNRPHNFELLLNSFCPSNCRHCIYPPDYHRFNKNMTLSSWDSVFEKAYHKFGFRIFVFNGRFFTNDNVSIIRFLKKKYNDAAIGVITSGNISGKTVDAIIEAGPDWIDVSVDGPEKQHDIQRAEKGSFKKTLKILYKFRDSGAFEKINVLTCLTRINIDSVTEMVKQLNGEGFPNFFMTPLTIMKGYRPDPDLRPLDKELIDLINKIFEAAALLDDSWLELNIFDPEYAFYIDQLRPDIFKQSHFIFDHYEYISEINNNEIHICYYPSSIAGVRELVVNSNADIIPPKVVAMGKIKKELIFDNILNMDSGEDFYINLLDRPAFSFYMSELHEEMKWLNKANSLLKND